MSELNKNRDFIDFLTLLYYKKIQFLIILAIFLSAGFYFNQSSNSLYKFEIEMHVASLDNFYESDNFQKQLNLAMNENVSEGKVDLITLNSFTWSFDQAKAFIDSLKVNGIFFEELASSYNDAIANSDVEEEIMSSITYNQVGKYGSIMTFELVDKKLARFLELNFINFLVDYTSNKLSTHLGKMKTTALSLLESKALAEIDSIKKNKIVYKDINQKLENFEGSLGDKKIKLYGLSDKNLDANFMDYSSFGESYKFIKSMKVPADISLYRHNSSNLKEVKKINTVFLYVLLIFAALFIHTFVSVLDDLRKQIIDRSESKGY
mgnify:CR=1 FL=1